MNSEDSNIATTTATWPHQVLNWSTDGASDVGGIQSSFIEQLQCVHGPWPSGQAAESTTQFPEGAPQEHFTEHALEGASGYGGFVLGDRSAEYNPVAWNSVREDWSACNGGFTSIPHSESRGTIASYPESQLPCVHDVTYQGTVDSLTTAFDTGWVGWSANDLINGEGMSSGTVSYDERPISRVHGTGPQNSSSLPNSRRVRQASPGVSNPGPNTGLHTRSGPFVPFPMLPTMGPSSPVTSLTSLSHEQSQDGSNAASDEFAPTTNGAPGRKIERGGRTECLACSKTFATPRQYRYVAK